MLFTGGFVPGACILAAKDPALGACWLWARRFGVDREPCRSCIHAALTSPGAGRAGRDANDVCCKQFFVSPSDLSTMRAYAYAVLSEGFHTFFTPTLLAREPPTAGPLPGALARRLSFPKILAARASFFLRSRPNGT